MTKPGHKNARVLLVDDEAISLKIMELSLIEHGFQVSAFDDPRVCLSLAESGRLEGFHCLVTDYSMPGMNGVAFMHRMKTLDPTLSVILATGEHERAIIQDSLREGAFDFLDKPLDVDRFYESVEGAVNHTFQLRKRAATEASLRAANSTGLLKNIDCPEWMEKLSVVYAPKHQLGGDFVDVFENPDGSRVCLLGDISGHDIQSALLSSHFLGTVLGWRTSRSQFDPALTFSHYNDILCRKRDQILESGGFGGSTSLCVCAVTESADNRTLSIVNAGIPAIHILAPDGTLETLHPDYSPLGWFPGINLKSHERAISQCSRILAYTDGTLELAMRRNLDVLSLVASIIQHSEPQNHPLLAVQEDDVLIVDLNLSSTNPTPIPLVQGSYAGNQSPQIDTFEQIWRNSLFLILGDRDEQRVNRFILACREGVLNALNHGCGGKPHLSATLSIRFDENTSLLEAQIDDPGKGHNFDYETRDAHLVDLLPGNLGLVLISKLVDEMLLDNAGASLIIRTRL